LNDPFILISLSSYPCSLHTIHGLDITTVAFLLLPLFAPLLLPTPPLPRLVGGDESEVPVALDELMFYKLGNSEEIGRREWTTSVLEVYIDGTRSTLYYLANILRKDQNFDHYV
jgi:hypothetical protein